MLAQRALREKKSLGTQTFSFYQSVNKLHHSHSKSTVVGAVMTVYVPAAGVSFSSILTMPVLTTLVPIGSAYIPYINFVDALTAAAFTALVPGTPNTNFAATFSGQFLVTLGGAYTFCIASDDGSTLSVDGSLVVNNSATHGSRNLCSSAITLSAGLHSIYAYYFQAGGYVQTQVTYSGPDTSNSKVLVQFNATGSTSCTSCASGSFSSVYGVANSHP